MSIIEVEGAQASSPAKKTSKRGPTQTKDSPSANRIRDNQRRSRARRKEYVEDLQRQVQEYERRGIEASMDLQRAARDVALENSRLRTLLAHRGVSADDIDAYLRSFGDVSPTPSGTLSQSSQHTQYSPYVHPSSDASARSTPSQGHPSQLDPLSVLADASTKHESAQSLVSIANAPPTHYYYNRAPNAPANPAWSTSHTKQEPASDPTSPLQMSCNAAARIIADMQGHGDALQARSNLGCRMTDQDCVVKNVTVFRALEQP